MRLKLLALLFLLPLTAQPAYAAKPTASPTPTPTPVVKSVCLDPGHGGTDPGAQYFGLNESDLNLSVGLDLSNRLTTLGYTVHMTRSTDLTLSNADRYNYCNSTNATLVVAIHQNASTNPNTDYTEVLYAKHGDKTLAVQSANIIGAALGLTSTSTNFADGVLLKTNAPAILTEALFMSNQKEASMLQDWQTVQPGDRIDQEAAAIQSAIQAYYGN